MKIENKDSIKSTDINNNESGNEKLYAIGLTGKEVITQISVDKLKQFKDHPFKPYTGKQLEKLTNSIKEYGILQPLIVRPLNDDEYEIISGHNRKNAAKYAGLKDIPVIIREDLKNKDDETILLLNASNVAQRSFNDWLHSEKVKSIFQYHEAIKRQGSRTDRKSDVTGQNDQKFDARKKTAEVYAVDENVIKRYLSINKLVDPLKDKLDNKEFGISSAIHLAQIPEEPQLFINQILDEDKNKSNAEKLYQIDGKNTKELRKKFEYVNVSNDEIKKSLMKTHISEEKPINIKMTNAQYSHLFKDEQTSEEIENEIVEAITYYRENKNRLVN